ncbi:MAG: hypothetical protein DRP87_16890 [Spirochaetes bacterium]|nr:MAG: hypothetical protein DRP87_16890 [Spirochaetota bacterium]
MFSTGISIFINFIFLFIIFLFFKNKIDKNLHSSEMLNKIREEINQIIIELNQTTNRNIALVEERLRKLTETIQKADKCITLLNRERDKYETAGDIYRNIKVKKTVPERKIDEEGKKSLNDEVMNLYRKGISAQVIATKLNKTMGEIELIISLNERKG